MSFSEPRFLRYTDGDIAFGVAICLVLGMVVWQWHYPKVTQIQALRARAAEQQRALAEVEQMETVVAAARSEADGLTARLTGYETSVFGVGGVAGRLEEFARLQEECGVELGSISPGAERSEGWYMSVPMTVIARGSFEELLCFVHRLEDVMVAADMNALRFTADLEGADMTASVTLRVLTGVDDRPKTQEGAL